MYHGLWRFGCSLLLLRLRSHLLSILAMGKRVFPNHWRSKPMFKLLLLTEAHD